MSLVTPLFLFLFLFLFFEAASCDPLSTFSVSHVANSSVVICALLPTSGRVSTPALNCTVLDSRLTRTYPHRGMPYWAIAAGNGFLCGLTADATTMLCWEFSRDGTVGPAKRVYRGPGLSALSAGDDQVCGLDTGTGTVVCWRWPDAARGPVKGSKLSALSVGRDFLCGLAENGTVTCTGPSAGVTARVPEGNYALLGAGTRHACAVSAAGKLACWGDGPAGTVNGPAAEGKYVALALGEDRTCALREDSTAACWGARGFRLPGRLGSTEFASIGGRGQVFCGVVTADFSLACWGRHDDAAEAVFARVLPGPCRPASDCACGMLSDSGSVCGDNGVVCLLCKLARPAHASPKRNRAGPRMRLTLIIVGTVGVVSCLLGALLAFVLFGPRKENKRRVHDSGRHGGPWLENMLGMGHGGKLKEFKLEELSGATDGFSEAHRIGTGSFGGVYRAVLSDGRAVALKRAEPARPASILHRGPGRERDDFVSELASLSRLNHKNLVRLFGHCSDGAERVLVYEYVANGSLHDHLFRGRAGPLDSWAARMRVALDAARGVEYLHAYAMPPVVHRDIKSSNILLGLDWDAKVTDFGLSRFGGGADVDARAEGTVGYMDPEYYRMRRLTMKSDVYSFGVVLLELLTGLRAIHWDEEARAPRNVVDLPTEGGDVRQALDKRLPPPTPVEIEAVERIWEVAASCVRLESHDRPTMTDVVAGLECAVTVCLEPECLSRSTTGDRSST